MKIVIDISEYDREWIRNAYNIPQEIIIGIAEAIIDGKELPNAITERGKWISEEYQKGWNAYKESLEKL